MRALIVGAGGTNGRVVSDSFEQTGWNVTENTKKSKTTETAWKESIQAAINAPEELVSRLSTERFNAAISLVGMNATHAKTMLEICDAAQAHLI